MNSEELMIGNWIEVNGVYQQVCELPLPKNCNDDNTKPIPLTEEILLKCGFENLGDYLLFHIEDFANIIWFTDVKYCNYYHIKYLNQLQNLIFALTNEHLKIEL